MTIENGAIIEKISSSVTLAE